MLDDFQVDSKNGVFQCVVHPPPRHLYQGIQEDAS